MVLDATHTGLTLYGDKTTATNATPLIAKTSTGVGLGIMVDTGGVGYSHVTQHIQGSKVFATGYDSTAIYTKDVAAIGTVEVAKPESITATTEFTSSNGWTVM